MSHQSISAGIWCLNSYGRPDQCKKTIDSMIAHGSVAKGVLCVNADDPQIDSYRSMELPARWKIMEIAAGNVGTAECFRSVFRKYRGVAWVGLVSDDTIIESDGFERALVDAAGAWGISSSNDGWQAKADVMQGRMVGIPVFGGKFLRALGYLAPGGFHHLYLDDLWEALGRTLRNWKVLMDVSTPHLHPLKTGEPMDATTSRVNTPEMYEHDKAAYDAWVANDAQSDVNRVHHAMERAGYKNIAPPVQKAPQPNSAPGFWIYLWDGDDRHFERFFRAIQEHGCSTQGAIAVPPGKTVPNCPWVPKGWGIGLPNNVRDCAWVGFIWADCAPQRSGWDQNMLTHIQPWSVVASTDVRAGDWRHGILMFGSAVFNILAGFDFGNIDESRVELWRQAVEKAQNYYIRDDAQCPRENILKSPPPPTDPIEVEMLTSALTKMMAAHNVTIVRPDYAGVRLQIATPSHSSRPEFVYQTSMEATKRHLTSKGVYTSHAWELHNADICLGRSRLVSQFIQSDCTHLLMIDDDMGWEVSAIERLIFADKDFVAVAGPKKQYPLRFAATHIDDNGQPLPVTMNSADFTAEVSLVGAAFLMVRRAVIERMISAFPETRYIGADSKESWALFMPFVRNNFYHPEDFAFCQRWRDIGGKVYICPDVPLKHVGTHCYEGDMWSNNIKISRGD